MSKILVIDDEVVIRDLIIEILDRAGYDTIGAETPARALEIIDAESLALVVSDIMMPELSGLQLLDIVRERRPSVPVVLVTGAGTYENLTDALARGADGLVIKPFAHAELIAAVESAMTRAKHSEVDMRERVLAPALAAALANAIEERDTTMQGHCERMSELARRIAEKVGVCEPELTHVGLGAILHDVGKIGIPDRILLKETQLTPEERALMRTHPLIGDRLLQPLELLEHVRPIVRHHHERWDGTGYPDGLAALDIPLSARIVAVADAVEAMSADRPYRPPLATDAIVRELREGAGTQFDPHIAELATTMIENEELWFAAQGLRVAVPDEAPLHDRIKSILLVEDDPDQALVAVDAIESAMAHVRVVHAPDVASATELCRSSTWSLALLDNRLPDGTGLDVLRILHEVAPGVPAVMITGAGSEEVAVEAFRRGAVDYIVKGGAGYMDDLAHRVRMLLEAA
jgi:putative two-component system response regulator